MKKKICLSVFFAFVLLVCDMLKRFFRICFVGLRDSVCVCTDDANGSKIAEPAKVA